MHDAKRAADRAVRAGIAAIVAAACALPVASPAAVDEPVPRADGRVTKKVPAPAEPAASLPLLGTLVDTHGESRIPLDDAVPTADRFAAVLADRVTGEAKAPDPRLLGLVRALAARHAGAGVEIVSGYRSPKRNEMMRKKGHHVASHSQHSLGHALDFRVVMPGAERGLDPRALEAEIRALGWEGGVGVYTLPGDWFVHADVGKRRRWDG